MTAAKPYTDADVEVAINAYHWAARNSCGPDDCPGAAVCVYAEHLAPEPFRAALDALAAAGWGDHAEEVRTTADEMTRAVKRLVGERDDARAEAKGARDDYEQLKRINAELADERDRLKHELNQIRRAAILVNLAEQP